MYIDRLLFPILTLGPGKRLVIWTRGCTKHCPLCANPELWDIEDSRDISPEDLFRIVLNIHRETPIDGITISGGDPLEQPSELLKFLKLAETITEDILVYTGYVFEEIERTWDMKVVDDLRENIGVLIDGPYIDELNEESLVLTGSSNQKIIYFNENLREKYAHYLSGTRKIQNVYMGNRLVSVGMHNRKEV